MVRSVQWMSETETNKFKLNFTSSAASAPFQMGKFSLKIKLLLDGARACVVVISRTDAYGISRDYDNVINFAIKDFNSNIFASRANRRRRRRTETTHNLHGVLPIQIVWCCTLRHRHQPHHTTMYLLRVSICLDRLPFCLFSAVANVPIILYYIANPIRSRMPNAFCSDDDKNHLLWAHFVPLSWVECKIHFTRWDEVSPCEWTIRYERVEVNHFIFYNFILFPTAVRHALPDQKSLSESRNANKETKRHTKNVK